MRALLLMGFVAVVLVTSIETASASGPSPEILDELGTGEPPRPPRRDTGSPSVDSVLAPAGNEVWACYFVPRTLPQSLLCEYAARALRTFGEQNRGFCLEFTDLATNLGEGGERRPANGRAEGDGRNPQVRQQCRTLTTRIQSLEQRIRSGQLKADGVAEAAAIVTMRFNAQVRTWQSMRRRARAQCQNDSDRATFDQAWSELLTCTHDLNQAFQSLAGAR